jgi:heterotetrameric sarcosine oxidase gamma subunit
MLDVMPDRATLAPVSAICTVPTAATPEESCLTLSEVGPVWSAELHCFAAPTAVEHKAFEERFGVPLPAPRETTIVDGRAIFSIGLKRWLLMTAARPTPEASPLWPEDAGAIISQAQGRVLVLLAGRGARNVLAKGTSLDVRPEEFAVGQCAVTGFAHVAAAVARVGEDAYLLAVPRSYAQWLWDWIAMSAREHHPRVLPMQPLHTLRVGVGAERETGKHPALHL